MNAVGSVLVESMRVAWASRVVTGLIVVLGIAVPASVLGASGRNIEAQALILSRVDEVGARLITVVSGATSPIIPASSVERLAGLDGVTWVVGLGSVSDVRLRAPAGAATPLRAFYGIRAPVSFSGGGLEGTDAFVSVDAAHQLGLLAAFGTLDPDGARVVGWFSADDPLQDLEKFVLLRQGNSEGIVERLIIAIDDVGWVEPVAAAIPGLIGAAAASGVSIVRSPALLEARAAVQDEVVRQDRVIVVALLALSVLLTSAVVFAGTLASRRDFGRRRALGASQAQLMSLVILTTLWPALIGTAIGTGAGWAYLTAQLGHAPAWEFPVSVAVLAILALLMAAAGPAVAAARRDPLSVLRIA